MAFAVADRVREQVSAFAGGTGAVTLPVVAVSGCQTFLAGWGASGTGWYCLVIGNQWETGFGTLNAGGTTLTRTTPKNGSSGAGVAVNFSAGTMDCTGVIPASALQNLLEVQNATVTPVWTGGGTPPAIGNGTISARVERIGKCLKVDINLTMGSTTTYGNGNWSFSLPSPWNSASIVVSNGVARMLRTGVAYHIGVAQIPGTAAIDIVSENAGGGWSATAPATWGTNDVLTISIIYPVVA
jgi:hypothetical protein